MILTAAIINPITVNIPPITFDMFFDLTPAKVCQKVKSQKQKAEKMCTYVLSSRFLKDTGSKGRCLNTHYLILNTNSDDSSF